MPQIIDKSQLHVLNRGGDLLLNTRIEQDTEQVSRDNWEESQHTDGFSDGRTMRKTASMPQVDYLNAIKLGYGLDSTDPQTLKTELNRYLNNLGRDLGNQTVKNILTPGRSANIIVR